MGTTRTLLLQWLDSAGHATRAPDRWVSARTVARRLAPGADAEAIDRDLTQLQREGLVERWFRGGRTYFRVAP